MNKTHAKRLLSLILAFATAGACTGVAYCSEETVQIGAASELVQYRELINSGIQKDAVLTADIDLNELETEWTPIGNTKDNQFSARFDGGGYRISGLHSTGNPDLNGLFGYTNKDSVIENLSVEGTVQGKSAGGIAGISYGLIQNCTSLVCVNAESYAGGIAAMSYGTIDGCANFGEITVTTNYAGGITGHTTTPVNRSQNYGFVSGNSYIGGITGYGASMSQNANYGRITSVGEFCGGVAGMIKGIRNTAPNIQIDNCTNKGEIHAAKDAGGVFGSVFYGFVSITNCVNDGNVTGSGEWIGGVIGSTSYWEYDGTFAISQCANRAPVHSVGNYAGGIVGNMLVGDISDSYNTAPVTSVLTSGGIVGFAHKGTTTIKNTFNYSNNALCFSNASCENVYALNSSVTAQKKTKEEFQNGTVLGLLNHDDLWVQGADYPVLQGISTISGIKTAAELKAALADPDITTIELAANIDVNETLKVNRSITVNGNGYQINGADTVFEVTSADFTLHEIALSGGTVFIRADTSNIYISGIVRMYNSEDIAIRLDQSRLFIPDNAVFFTMPGYAVSSDTEQAFSVRHTQSMIDNRYLYCFNNSGTMFQKVSNVVLKACDNAGLSYDVYGLIKSGKLYLMVPSCVDLSNCIYTEIDKNGMEYNKVHADFTGDTDYQVTIGAISYSVTAMQSTLPTLYIEINEEYGTIDAMNTSEDHSVCAYGDLTLDVPQKLVDQYGWLPKYQSSESDADLPGTVEVRGRGNSTWSTSEFRKKPYQIKTEKKIDLLGMGKAKTWCLIKDGGYFVGQKLGLDLGLALGLSCTPDSRFVDVYMNGEYIGCYTLTEKVQVKKERVEITDLEEIVEETGITPETDLTGGYLMEIDNYAGDPIVLHTNGNSITVKSPENLDSTATKDNHYSYIYNLMDDLFTAIYGDGKMKDGSSYLDHIDIESFVRYYWHQELIENMDCGIGSTYLYKDTDAINPKLFAGPVWDNDNIFKSEDNIEQWYAKNLVQYGGNKTLYNQLMCRRDFVSYAIWYYENSNIRETLASAANLVQSYRNDLGNADNMDFIRWGVNTFNEQILSSYLSRRFAWIDENYRSLMDEATIGEEIDVDSIMGKDPDPNPVIDDGSYASFRFENGQSAKPLDKSYGSFDTGYYPTHGSIENARLKAFLDSDTSTGLIWSAPEYAGSQSVVPTVQATAENGWKNQEENPAFIQIELPMTGYTNAAFSAKLAATKKGPKNYKLMYSLDGTEYKELGRYSLQSNKKLEQAFDNIPLPTECDNSETVYLRIAVANNETVGGLSLTDNPASGEFAIQDIVVSKYEIPLDYSITGIQLLDASGKEISSIRDKESFEVKISLKKSIDKDEPITCIAALYDENGRYNGIRMMKLDAKNPYSASISFQYEQKDVVLKKMKVFLWGNLNQQIPLCPAKDIELR